MSNFNKILLLLHHHEDAASKLQKIYISKLFLCQRVKDILFDILVVKALSCKAMTKFYCKGMHCNHGQDISRGITSQQKSGRDMSGLGRNGRSRHIPNFEIKNWGDLGFSLIFPAFLGQNTGKSRVNLNFSRLFSSFPNLPQKF